MHLVMTSRSACTSPAWINYTSFYLFEAVHCPLHCVSRALGRNQTVGNMGNQMIATYLCSVVVLIHDVGVAGGGEEGLQKREGQAKGT